MRSRREREARAHWRPHLFTNREAELAAFRDLLANLGDQHASVLALPGISGNGKTWLARPLRHELRERPPHARVPHAVVDLDGATDLADHEFLLAVRNGLAASGGIRFNAFDIGLVLFWSLLPDQRPPRIVEGDAVAPGRRAALRPRARRDARPDARCRLRDAALSPVEAEDVGFAQGFQGAEPGYQAGQAIAVRLTAGEPSNSEW